MIHILTKNQCELVGLLAQSKEVMSGEHLSDRLGLSTKTVQRYIDLINRHLSAYDAEIISMRGYGYILQGNVKDIGDIITALSVDGYDRRIKDIAVCLLSKEYVTVDGLADQLFYSASMMNRLTQEVKKYLGLHRLKLVSKPYYGMSVTGSEMDIRALMIDCAFAKNRYGQLTCYIKNISPDEFQTIHSVILKFLQRHSIIIADDDAYDLIMRMAVIVARCRQSHFLNDHGSIDERNLAWLLLQEIAAACGLRIPITETAYLAIYFDVINHQIQEEPSASRTNIQQLVEEALEKTRAVYEDLTVSDTVRESLALHLSLMLNRIHHGHYIKNELLPDIKANYILEMNYAITFGKWIEVSIGMAIPEDELGYLALYFALNNHKKHQAKRVIILCSYGIATSQLIREQIREHFPQLEVVGIYPLYYLEVVMSQDIDLIISTIALEQSKVTKPLVVIKQFLDEGALGEIRQVIEGPSEASLLKFFRPDAFFLPDAATKEDALAQMAFQMLAHGYFDQGTIDKIIEREGISSTDIGNLVAIPHAITGPGRPSVIGIGILDKPILWDKEKVQVIFMIGMNYADAHEHNVFRHLYRIIKDVFQIVKRLR